MQAAFHPYLRDGWTPSTPALDLTATPVLPDVNPADMVVARMRAKRFGSDRGSVMNGLPGTDGKGEDGGNGGDGSNGGSGGSGSGGGGGGGGGGSIAALTTRVAAAEAAISSIQAALATASISAVCNGDGTITVTLTLPD